MSDVPMSGVPMSGRILLRDAVVGDADALGRLHVLAWQRAFGEIFAAEDLAALDPRSRAEGWRTRLVLPPEQRPVASVVATSAEGDVLGFTNYGPARDDHGANETPDMGEVWAIYAHPDHLGRGIGAALMNNALSGLAAAAHPAAMLWTPKDNHVGRNFYTRGGWTLDGAEHVYTFGSRDVVEVRYRISLPPDRSGGSGH